MKPAFGLAPSLVRVIIMYVVLNTYRSIAGQLQVNCKIKARESSVRDFFAPIKARARARAREWPIS